MSEMDHLIKELTAFDIELLTLWGYTNHKIELFGINHPSLYVVPSVEEIAVKKAVDFIRDATASVVVSGPLGAGKTTFMEILEKSLKKIPKIFTIRIEGVSSADAFLDDVLHTDYGDGSTYEEFWRREIGVKTLKHGSIAKRLSRILLAMRRSAEKLNARYVILIDEFRQLERVRGDTRSRIIDTLLKMVNEKTRKGRRYLILVLAVITRVGESAYKTIEVLSTVGEDLGHGTKSAIRRRFVEVYDIQKLDEESALKIMIYRLASMKNKLETVRNYSSPLEIKPDELTELLKPFTMDGLKAIYKFSGGNPGSILELLIKLIYDSLRGTEKLIKEGYSINDVVRVYQLNEDYVLKFASKEVKRAKAELSRFQQSLLEYLSTTRDLDEISDWLTRNNRTWEDVVDDFDLFEKRGLIYSPTRGQIQTTDLWVRGSKYI